MRNLGPGLDVSDTYLYISQLVRIAGWEHTEKGWGDEVFKIVLYDTFVRVLVFAMQQTLICCTWCHTAAAVDRCGVWGCGTPGEWSLGM